MNLEDLVKKIQNTDDCWENLYNLMKKRILFWANNDEDLAQISWIKIYTNIHNYDSSRSFLAWAKTVVKNTTVDEARTLHSRKCESFSEILEFDPELPPDEQVANEEMFTILEDAMRSIYNRHKIYYTCLDLFSRGYTLREVSEIMNKPMGTVKRLTYFAKKALRREFIKRGFHEFPIFSKENMTHEEAERYQN